MFTRIKQIAKIFKRELQVYRCVMRHPKTPRLAKVLLWLAIGYLALPIDLIPDWIPVIGYLDDVLIVPGLIFFATRLIPSEIVAECRQLIGDGNTEIPNF